MFEGQRITGELVFTTVTVWLQVAVLLQASVACQVRVMTIGQIPLVTVLRMVMVTFVPLQLSLAVGASKVHGVLQLTVLLVAQVRTGGVVSTTVTVWLQVAVLLQASVAIQVRVMTCGHTPLVTVLRTVSVTFVPLQLSLAVGASNVQAVPQLTVLLVAQVRTGGVVSTTVTVWLQVVLLVHASMAIQVRVMTCGHTPLVTVPRTVSVILLVPLQPFTMVGGSKLQAVPQLTVLSVAQVITGVGVQAEV